MRLALADRLCHGTTCLRAVLGVDFGDDHRDGTGADTILTADPARNSGGLRFSRRTGA